MKPRHTYCRTTVLMWLFCALCGGPAAGVHAQAQATTAATAAPPHATITSAPLVLKVATAQARGSATAEMLATLERHLQQASLNQLQVKTFSDGALGDSAALIERTRAGTLQACVVSLEALARQAPALGVLLSPYLFKNDAQADARLDGPVRAVVERILRPLGLTFGAFGASEMRGFLIRGEPPPQRLELEGRSAPAPESEAQRKTQQALGLRALDRPLSRLVRAPELSVQGVATTPLEAVAAGLVSVPGGYRDTRHALDAQLLVLSTRWLEGLPEDARTLLSELPQSLTDDARKAARVSRARVLAGLRERGVPVLEPAPEARAASARALRKVADELARELGDEAQALLRAARGAR